jgi:hypothetical protein
MKMIHELMVTEETHVESLKTVVVEYLQPLRALLSKDQVKKLFGNIEVIMGWNMQFLNHLRLRQEESEAGDDDGMYFGDVMAEMARLNISHVSHVLLIGLITHVTDGHHAATLLTIQRELRRGAANVQRMFEEQRF